MLIRALEAGGIEMMCAVGKEDDAILEQVPIPTTTPEETVSRLVEYSKDKEIETLDVATFDPVDVRPRSGTHGYILSTPKLTWRHEDLLGRLKAGLKVSMGLDTNVNGSCPGEMTYGCTRGLDNIIYITIGIGVGAGIYANGELLHGMLHPEGGHILLARHENGSKDGICPYHKNCLEGFTSGPSIETGWGKKVMELMNKSEVWEVGSYCTAQALVDYIVLLSSQKIALGGGIMHQEQLFPMIRQEAREMLNGYIEAKELEGMDSYIVSASLHDDQGVMGCIELGLNALQA